MKICLLEFNNYMTKQSNIHISNDNGQSFNIGEMAGLV